MSGPQRHRPLHGGALTPPPFASLSIRQGSDGQPWVRYSGDRSHGFIGFAAADFLSSHLGRQLMPRVLRLLAAEEADSATAEEEFTFVEGDGRLRPLHCRMFRLVDARGNPMVGIVLHDVTDRWSGDHPESRRSSDLMRLLRLSEILLEQPPLREGLDRMLHEIATAPRIICARLVFLEPDGVMTRTMAVAGARADEPLPGSPVPIDEPAGTALGLRQLVVTRAADNQAGWIVHVPVVAGERAVGLMVLGSHADPSINPWRREVLAAYADYVAAFVTVAGEALGPPPLPPDSVAVADLLTRRQQDVLYRLVMHGESNRQIGVALHLEETTVKVHMGRILKGLEVARRTEVVNLIHGRAARWLADRRRLEEAGDPPVHDGHA
jgi:DNA-binding CsgD family transcriptional regulator